MQHQAQALPAGGSGSGGSGSGGRTSQYAQYYAAQTQQLPQYYTGSQVVNCTCLFCYLALELGSLVVVHQASDCKIAGLTPGWCTAR